MTQWTVTVSDELGAAVREEAAFEGLDDERRYIEWAVRALIANRRACRQLAEWAADEAVA